MYIKIPFENEIDFKTSISEITKMSLEHDFNVNDGVILGNFYISGEYKMYPVSVTKEPFNYTLPFTVELRDDINLDTLELNIEDFSYDIKDDNKLKVNIEYSVKADIKEEKDVLDNFERVDEKELDNEIEYIDSFLEENKGREGDLDGEVEEDKRELKEESMLLEEEKTIMNTIKDSDDTFVTYHIHIVNIGENIDSICKKYNIDSSVISEYNNVDNISEGDKIIIPEIDE